MNYSKIVSSSEKMSNRVTKRHEKKLQIIQDDRKLTAEEKDILYSNYLEKLKKQTDKVVQLNLLSDSVINTSQQLSNNQALNALAGIVGIVGVVYGGMGLALNAMPPEALSSFQHFASTLGGVLVAHSLLNFNIFTGTSLAEEIGAAHMHKRETLAITLKHVQNTITEMKKENAKKIQHSWYN